MSSSSAVHIERISVEHYQLPLGINESRPRLSWRFGGNAPDWKQGKYEVEIAHTGGRKEKETITVESEENILVSWPVGALRSRQGATVRVRAAGAAKGKTEEWTDWAEVYLEAGLLDQAKDWTARPVSGEKQDADKPKRPIRVRKTFNVPAEGEKARLYVTALGVYEVYVNGQRVGDHFMAPGWQSYDHRITYQTFDVSKLLKHGEENTIAAWIGEGWYVGRMGFGAGRRNIYGERMGLLAHLDISGETVVKTDEGWEWAYGSLISSEIYDGEVWDSKAESDDEGWKEGKSGGGEGWKKVEVLDTPQVKLLAAQSPPVRPVTTFQVKEVIKTPSGKTILDFGQNIAGFVRILSEPPATAKEIVLNHAEVLERGELGTRPLRGCKATDRIFTGGKIKGYSPRFTFHGFRYVQVDGWEGVKAGDIESVVVNSNMDRTGHFECSHALINRLHKNVVYSTLGNTISIPTDCPQRDERLGWTGDIQVFTPTLNYLFDGSGFLSDWLTDLYHDQKKLKGVVPVVIPDILDNRHTAAYAVWGDVAALTPFDLHTAFADKEVLERQYQSMVDWLDKGVVRDSKTNLWLGSHDQLSDWLAPAAPPTMPALAPTDNWLVADAYLIHTTRTAAKICRIIGKESKAKEYEGQAEKMLKEFYEIYITPRGRVMSDTQTALALIVQFDLFPIDTKVKQILFDRLAELTRKDLFRVSTGFAGTPIILLALEKAGYLSNAYRMLQEPTTPSFLSPVLLGATTIWERWDSMLDDGSINPGEMTSFNHYALGSVAHFMHTVIGGLSPQEPGWKKVSVKPQPGGTVTSASTSFVSGYGKVACSWKLKSEGKRLEVEVEVPPNTTAVVELPGGKKEEVGSGKYNYDVEFKKDVSWPPKILQPPCCKPVKDSFLP